MCDKQDREAFECPFLERLTPEQRREKIKSDPFVRACLARHAEMVKRSKRARALSSGACKAAVREENLAYLV